jgi:hypothetical protein
MSEKDALWNSKRKEKRYSFSRSSSMTSSSAGPLDNFMKKKVKKNHHDYMLNNNT